MTCRLLRVLLREKAHDAEALKGLTNEEMLKYWRVAPMRVEIAVRRTSWLQATSKAPQEHAQVTTAVWSTMLRESPLDSVGHLTPDAHRYAGMLQGDLELFWGISGTEAFFDVWKGDSRKMFEVGGAAIEFSLLDPWRSGWFFCPQLLQN